MRLLSGTRARDNRAGQAGAVGSVALSLKSDVRTPGARRADVCLVDANPRFAPTAAPTLSTSDRRPCVASLCISAETAVAGPELN